MEKRHISAHGVMQDINSGMDDAALMDKYRLSRTELNLLMKKLVAAKLIGDAELSELQLLWAQKKGMVWHCPACHMPQSHEFDECPQCGIIVAKFREKFSREHGIAGVAGDETMQMDKPGDQEFIEVPPDGPEEETGPPARPDAAPAGEDSSPTCSGCRRALPQDAKFCPLCGTKVPTSGPR